MMYLSNCLIFLYFWILSNASDCFHSPIHQNPDCLFNRTNLHNDTTLSIYNPKHTFTPVHTLVCLSYSVLCQCTSYPLLGKTNIYNRTTRTSIKEDCLRAKSLELYKFQEYPCCNSLGYNSLNYDSVHLQEVIIYWDHEKAHFFSGLCPERMLPPNMYNDCIEGSSIFTSSPPIIEFIKSGEIVVKHIGDLYISHEQKTAFHEGKCNMDYCFSPEGIVYRVEPKPSGIEYKVKNQYSTILYQTILVSQEIDNIQIDVCKLKFFHFSNYGPGIKNLRISNCKGKMYLSNCSNTCDSVSLSLNFNQSSLEIIPINSPNLEFQRIDIMSTSTTSQVLKYNPSIFWKMYTGLKSYLYNFKLYILFTFMTSILLFTLCFFNQICSWVRIMFIFSKWLVWRLTHR